MISKFSHAKNPRIFASTRPRMPLDPAAETRYKAATDHEPRSETTVLIEEHCCWLLGLRGL